MAIPMTMPMIDPSPIATVQLTPLAINLPSPNISLDPTSGSTPSLFLLALGIICVLCIFLFFIPFFAPGSGASETLLDAAHALNEKPSHNFVIIFAVFIVLIAGLAIMGVPLW